MRLLLIPLMAGCTVVTPPPLVPAHGISAPLEKGTTSVSLVVGIGGGVFVDDGFGFAVRVTNQVSERMELGGDLTFAFANPSTTRKHDQRRRELVAKGGFDAAHGGAYNAPRFLLGAQLIGRYTVDGADDIVSIPFGFGGGLADTKLRFLTAYAGVRIASTSGKVDAYGQPLVGISIPVVQGPPISRGQRPATTYWLGGSIGAVADGDGALGASTDLTMLYGDEAVLLFLSQGGTFRSEPDEEIQQ